MTPIYPEDIGLPAIQYAWVGDNDDKRAEG